MKAFDYKGAPGVLLTPEIVAMLSSIHEHKGKQELYIEAHADALTTLMEIAKIQSTGASNAIEGIHTTDKRLEELVRDKSAPRNRTEQEIAGYRDILATIHENYDYIYPRPNIILQLHKQLYSFGGSATGGSYKNSDNFIAETDAEGNQSVRFQPVPAFLTASAMDDLCTAFIESLEKSEYDPLLLIPMFVLDFLCIHPFNDGNGRMSRLLTLLLFYRAGYIVGKYISVEKLIEGSKDTYYEALQDSSTSWHENNNDYAPFVRYYLGVVQKAYNEFEERVEYLSDKGLSKPDRIKAFIDRKIGKVSKKEILEACPDISKITAERTLAALVKSGYLVKIGSGRSTAYGKTDKPGGSY
ncbi:MAG: Fic family protein [Gracilibacteraceae bacterium]|jgi:Fic family protein|nr:Fic family protein [Gracilibacteraceae bacterium]